ncbi:uncharacterized protein LOC125210629 isoform X2 [Salvia hispanica]|uniref:uncharacterized protein LOC125210629 isoform X2 n=1 Tax=Salvia hispanica TaxID=49212 RepID=UPI00200926BB|nr:uncharacterized protein LOC125210629 isoform X2 [Salvia hispanica]
MASKILIIVVFIFDVIAFGLAVAAEQRRSIGTMRSDSEDEYKYCVYSSDVATGYGVGALLLLMASQVIIMAASRCFCCGNPLKPGGSRACALLLFIFCWITFLIAEACLLAGSVRNAKHTKYRRFFFNNEPSCETVRKGVFAAGAAFTFFTAIVSEFYYLSYSKSRGSFRAHGGYTGVSMAAFK